MKKKLFGIAVALCVAMLLAACESGEKAIAQVEQAIADIGAVSLESEEAIAHAEELYSHWIRICRRR